MFVSVDLIGEKNQVILEYVIIPEFPSFVLLKVSLTMTIKNIHIGGYKQCCRNSSDLSDNQTFFMNV